MNNFRELLGVDMRSCKIDIAAFLDNLEGDYKIKLANAIEDNYNYDETSEFTRELAYEMKAQLEVLHKLELIDNDELSAMREAADDLRMQELHKLEC